MKVAVTGASGFLGRHVIRELSSRAGTEVVATSRSDPDRPWLPAGVRHVKLDLSSPASSDFDALGRPDCVVHLAWAGLPNYRSLHHFEQELPRQYAFLKSLLDGGLRSLLVTGTCYEYGMSCGRMDESLPPRPGNPYAYAKDALRLQLEYRRSVADFDLTWARLFYMHGVGQAATSLHPQLMAAIERGDDVFRMSGGEQLRDYLPVEAVAAALVDLALRAPGAGTVNVCSGRPVSVRSLVERWTAERGSSIALGLGQFPYPDYEPMAFWGARDRLDSLLGARPAVGGNKTSQAPMRQTLDRMFEGLDSGPEVYRPSKFWQQLNEKNIAQLEATGLENMKRTLAQNYFTWVVGIRSPLFRHLASLMRPSDWRDVLKSLPAYSRESGLGLRRFYELHVFTRMVWRLATKLDTRGWLQRIEEPAFGNPFRITFQGRTISQDLANSVMELYAITESAPPPVDRRFTVCELGAGYGRNGYAFLGVYPNCKYVIVDIPPALYVSQEYLSKVLPGRKVMRFSPFTDFGAVSQEFDSADIVFLLPHQAEMLPAKSVDYFVNISSLHEMTRAQVRAYFELIERLTLGHFYTKQWKSFVNVRDGITVSESDYPYPDAWRRIYSRTPASHPHFFEALYQLR